MTYNKNLIYIDFNWYMCYYNFIESVGWTTDKGSDKMNKNQLEGKLNRKLQKRFGGTVKVTIEGKIIRVSGHLSHWEDIVAACNTCVIKQPGVHVVNDVVLDGVRMPEMRVSSVQDKALDGERPDVLIIGGGISGCSIARELTKWKLNVLLVDKEADLAMQASGRNDGEVHPGVDLGRGTLKQTYVVRGNRMFDRICGELDVPFRRCGQYVGFTDRLVYPFIRLYAWQRRHICKVDDTRMISGKELHKREPNLNPDFKFALYNPSAGCVCPYGLTIAYGENAVSNGAKVSLNTAVLGMEVKSGTIQSVRTNRGTIYPRLVINAAGVFAEDIAKMAEDRFFSIHPRKGTNSILDQKAGSLVKSISSIKKLTKNAAHTKGGGILHTVHHNLLVGPNAVETYKKEDFATEQSSIDAVFEKQKLTAKGLSQRDIITYFSGVRAATFEEDFVIEKGRKTKNLIHCAGIQSPGLTTAPAVAEDVAKMAVQELQKTGEVKKNDKFNPRRKGIPQVKNLPEKERDRLIHENPDYGVIICRCEEISKGEILDALKSPIPVTTVDGVKKRVRPGMGRCQGGFCMPLVTKIISEHLGVPAEQVKKSGADSVISFGKTKEAK